MIHCSHQRLGFRFSSTRSTPQSESCNQKFCSWSAAWWRSWASSWSTLALCWAASCTTLFRPAPRRTSPPAARKATTCPTCHRKVIEAVVVNKLNQKKSCVSSFSVYLFICLKFADFGVIIMVYTKNTNFESKHLNNL